MKNFTKNDRSKNMLFTSLRNEEPGVSLAELKNYVASKPVASILHVPFSAKIISAIAISGLAIFLAFINYSKHDEVAHNSNIVEQQAMNMPQSGVSHETQAQSIAAKKVNSVKQLALNHITAQSTKSISNEKVNSNLPADSKNIISNASEVPDHLNINENKKDQKIPPVMKDSLPRSITQVPPSFLPGDPIITMHDRDAYESSNRLFGALQAGVIISGLNTSGGGIAISFDHDWQHVGFRYSSTFGTKGNSSELFRTFAHSEVYSQSVVEYTLQFGATLKQDDFWATFSAGPNYTNSFSYLDYFDTQFNQTVSTGSRWHGLGASVQAAVGYKFSKYFGTEITLFASDHSQVAYGGILFSAVVGIF